MGDLEALPRREAFGHPDLSTTLAELGREQRRRPEEEPARPATEEAVDQSPPPGNCRQAPQPVEWPERLGRDEETAERAGHQIRRISTTVEESLPLRLPTR